MWPIDFEAGVSWNDEANRPLTPTPVRTVRRTLSLARSVPTSTTTTTAAPIEVSPSRIAANTAPRVAFYLSTFPQGSTQEPIAHGLSKSVMPTLSWSASRELRCVLLA